VTGFSRQDIWPGICKAPAFSALGPKHGVLELVAASIRAVLCRCFWTGCPPRAWGSGPLARASAEQVPSPTSALLRAGEHRSGHTDAEAVMPTVAVSPARWRPIFALAGRSGDGTTADRLTPGAVAGLRRFAHVNAGGYRRGPEPPVRCDHRLELIPARAAAAEIARILLFKTFRGSGSPPRGGWRSARRSPRPHRHGPLMR
jgi:hypothetical protein